MAKKYQVKYGILYTPTKEYISWFDKGRAILFDTDKEAVTKAMTDMLYFDGGYDGDDEDFKVDAVTLPEDFDGSNLINDAVFINKQTIYNNI